MNWLLSLVTKSLQKPCQYFKLLRSQLKVVIPKFSENKNVLIGFLFAEIKDSNPIEVAEFNIAFMHDREPALN